MESNACDWRGCSGDFESSSSRVLELRRLFFPALVICSLVLPGFSQKLTEGQQPTVQPNTHILPTVTYDRLLNGLQILITEDHREPFVLAKLLVKYGAAFDLQGKSGTACVTVRALMAAGEDPAREGAKPRFLDADGKLQSTDCGQDQVTIWIRVTRRDAPAAIRFLASLVSEHDLPSFGLGRAPAGEAKPPTVEMELRGRLDAQLRKMLYQRHPYARSPQGDPVELGAIQRSDLSRFYRQFLIANNSILILVGDIERDALLPIIRPSFGQMRKGELTPASFVMPPHLAGPRIRIVQGGTIGGVGIATRVIERAHQDFLPLSILVRIIDARLVTALASFPRFGSMPPVARTLLSSSVMPGYLESAASVASSDAARMLAVLLETWRKLGEESIAKSELDVARSSLLREFEQQVDSGAGIADLLGQMELYGLGRDWAISYASRLGGVGPEDLQRVARAYLKPESAACVIEGEIGEQLEAIKLLGTVEEVR